jgi:DGQHR domain-containing protein
MTQANFDLTDPDIRELRFTALRASQPIGDLYFAVMSSTDVGLIANFDVRRVLIEERDVERYLGIQRPLQPRRVKDLQKYVNFSDATFPTAIILAIDDEYASYDERKMLLTVRNYRDGENRPSTNIRKIARVIDGQHRIAGLYGFEGPTFEVPVTLFIGSDISDQAYVFATVNLEQTKVSRSLTYDLFALAKTRSPQRTCHNIAVALDLDEKSPFFKRIKRLGVATPGRLSEWLTQAQFVENLLPYISREPKLDRDALLNGNKLEKVDMKTARRLIFRNMFIDERDLDIAQIIFNYFTAVERRWSDGWKTPDEGLILNRTNGFRALMKVLRPLCLKLGLPGQIFSSDAFYAEFRDVPVEYTHFNTVNYPPGSSGESGMRSDLVQWLGLVEIDRESSR